MITNNGWEFPVDQFRVDNGYFCILREEDARENPLLPDHIGADLLSTSIRLECGCIMIPKEVSDVNQDSYESPEVVINLMLPFNTLNDLAVGVIQYNEAEQGGEFQQGSMYLSGIYNDLKCTEIRFGNTSGDVIEAELDLHITLNPNIGEGQFHRTVVCPLELERQW